MIQDNITALRRAMGVSQEVLADKIGVTRQTVSKWESGESAPDLEKAKRLADFFDVSLDDLVSFESERTGLLVPPKGKHAFGVVKVGEKGQIVIPVKARQIFEIEPGDRLIVLGDEEQGIAIMHEKKFLKMVELMRTNPGMEGTE